MWMYYIFGAAWIVTCLMIGFYIRGAGLVGRRYYSLGLKILFLSYLAGICMLGLMIIYS